MGVREYFYTALRDQFNSDPSGSFLFEFLREERRAEGKDFAQASLEDLLELLANRNQKLQLNEKDRDALWALRKRVEGLEPSGIPEYHRGDRTRYRRLLEALRGHSEVVSEKELKDLREMVLNAVVIQDARTFLYNAEFSLDREEGRRTRKKDRMLRMLDAWCEDTGLSLGREGVSNTGALTDEERQAWNEMFRLLQGMKNPTNKILPVRVDAHTGVGLYLVGVKCFSREVQREMQKKGQKCVFVCLGAHDFYSDREEGCETVDEQIVNFFHLDMHPLDVNTTYCVTLEDGERLFSYILKSQSAYEFFREHNDIAPKGTPKLLQAYFVRTAQREKWDRTAQVEEGRREYELDRKRNPSPDFR